jgi:large subunit ribosomal protein L3
MTALLGKKIGMTQIYTDAGELRPVTVIQAGPCPVMQVKAVEKDGYDAIQLGFSETKKSRLKAAAVGHASKASTTPRRFVREVRLQQPAELALGDVVTVDAFAEVTFVDVVATSKGRGFAGGMKRYGFGGQPASHGTERKHRSPGAISSHATERGRSGKIKKGKRMAGHMGSVRRTARNQALLGVDTENNLLLVHGSVPGPNGGYVVVSQAKTRQ